MRNYKLKDKVYALNSISDKLFRRKKMKKYMTDKRERNSLNYNPKTSKESNELRMKLRAKAKLGTISDNEKQILYGLNKEKSGNRFLTAATAGFAGLGLATGAPAALASAAVGAWGRAHTHRNRISASDASFMTRAEGKNRQANGQANRERAKHLIDTDNKKFKALRKLKTHLRSNKSWGKERYKKKSWF